MIGSTISHLVSHLKYDKLVTNTTPNFYQGAYDELNKAILEENTGFVFLVRPEKWTSEIKKSQNVDSKYNLSIGFFCKNDYGDSVITSIDSMLDLLETLYQDFLKQVYAHDYLIENLTGEVIYNDASFDNNVSGILTTLTFIYPNQFNTCS